MMLASRTGKLALPSKTITEPARQIPLYGEYEVAVLGGGPAGIAAAIAASTSEGGSDEAIPFFVVPALSRDPYRVIYR
jgi:hypothetical protein